MKVRRLNSLLDAYQLPQDFERSLRFPLERRFSSKIEEQPRHRFESFTKSVTSTKDLKGKSDLSRVLRVLGVLGVKVLVILLSSVPLRLFL